MTKRKIKMNRKRSISIKAFLTLALTIAMCLGSLTTAYAAGEITGSEAAPAQAAITKVLQMPEGTVTPTSGFTFTVTSVSVDGIAATTTNMPVIAGQTLNFTSADTSTATSGIKSITKETPNIFASVTWPHAGEYVYNITETAGSATGMTYSSAIYEMTVYVRNGVTNPTVPYIHAIGTEITAVDNGTQTVGAKVDPTPGTGHGLLFTNTYIETPAIVDPGTGDMLSISKTVAGDYGNRTRYFPFSVTLNKAQLVTGTPVYKAYVMEGTAIVTSTDNSSAVQPADTYGPYINVTAGTPLTINLKHGQKLAFIGMPVGTTYTVTEAAAIDYTPSASVVVNGAAPAATNGTENTALTIGSPTAIILGANANSAAFTNTYKTVTPTGIALDSLPFIMIIVLAVGAFAAFIVVKSRRRA